MLDRENWSAAEILAREAVLLSENLGRRESIAFAYLFLSTALVRQGKKVEARTHAQHAVDIFTGLGAPDLPNARNILAECGNCD